MLADVFELYCRRFGSQLVNGCRQVSFLVIVVVVVVAASALICIGKLSTVKKN